MADIYNVRVKRLSRSMVDLFKNFYLYTCKHIYVYVYVDSDIPLFILRAQASVCIYIYIYIYISVCLLSISSLSLIDKYVLRNFLKIS